VDARAGTGGTPSRWSVWAALLLIYVVWGSTYLAIKVNIETMPPMLSGGIRFLVAGGILYLLLLARNGAAGTRVTGRELAACVVAGAALLVSSIALWIVILRLASRERVAAATVSAALVGFGGVALVAAPGAGADASMVGVLISLGSSISWAVGSFLSRRAPLPRDPFLATAVEMLAGGTILLALGLATGEAADFELGAISGRSVAGLAYLSIAGSLVSFSAYVWLLRHVPISKVVTHQYVNPLVAVLLGWALLSEEITAVMLAGAALIVGSVAVVVRRESGTAGDAAEATPTGAPAEVEPR
jgi:drug/metabolite transporter (DMT)-like permease